MDDVGDAAALAAGAFIERQVSTSYFLDKSLLQTVVDSYVNFRLLNRMRQRH